MIRPSREIAEEIANSLPPDVLPSTVGGFADTITAAIDAERARYAELEKAARAISDSHIKGCICIQCDAIAKLNCPGGPPEAGW